MPRLMRLYYHFGQVESATATESDIETSISTIRELYANGVPLFTKDAIRDVVQQLDALAARGWHTAAQEGARIAVKRLDGTIVEFAVETGSVRYSYMSDDSDSDTDRDTADSAREKNKRLLEAVIEAPTVMYQGYDHLTDDNLKEHLLPSAITYCSLEICHLESFRDLATKEPVSVNPPLRPLDEVKKLFKDAQTTWEASEACKQLRSTLESAVLPESITKIIALACGDMSYEKDDRNTSRSTFQHALILTLRDITSKKSDSHHIECYAQDPTYTEADKRVLEAHGITVLENPRAFLEVDGSSVVFACAPDIPVKQIVADIACPAVMIYNQVEEEDKPWSCTDADTPRVRKQIRDHYDTVGFPAEEEHFGDLAIYIRRSER